MKKLLIVTALLVGPALLSAQNGAGGLDPAEMTKPLEDQWTSYSGDLSGKRFSALKLVNTNTVKNLSLKWVTGLTTGCGPTGTAPAGGAARRPWRGWTRRRSRRWRRRGSANRRRRPRHRRREQLQPARLEAGFCSSTASSTPRSPDNVYAIDARDGALLWHYYWKTRGGTSLQTRGLGMWHDYIYFELHDDWVVCLDAKTGKEVWKHEIAPFDQQYFSSNAPMVIGDHILVGTGNDLDAPAFLKSLDPRTGAAAVDSLFDAAESRRSRTRDLAEPRRRTSRQRRDLDSRVCTIRRRTCICTAPATRRLPIPRDAAMATTSLPLRLIAVNVDTGKMAWYYQTSPHDTHDWDSTQTPVLVECHVQRADAEAGDHRHAQRLFLRARPHDRRTPGDVASSAS